MKIIPLIAVAALLMAGCDTSVGERSVTALQSVGLAAAPECDGVTLDILCDRPACTAETFGVTLETALPVIGACPDSEARTWIVGEHVTSAVLLGSRPVAERTQPGERAKHAHATAYAASASTNFRQAAQEYFAARPNTASPLAETLMRAAMSRPEVRSRRRIIVYITDTRQVVRPEIDFECGTLPSAEAFVEHLHRSDLLTAGSLRGIDVIFTCAAVTPVDNNRCAYSISRSVAVQRLWEAALVRAGARSIHFRTSPLASADLLDILAEVAP